MIPGTFLQDVRHALRSLTKSPGFTVIAIIALALGIGATTAIFSVVSAVLLRPLPYPGSNRIVVITTAGAASPVKFNFLRAWSNTFQDITAGRFGRVNLTGVEYPEQIRSAQVTAEYFRLFGQVVNPGRAFNPDEDRPGGHSVVVVSDAFWKRALGGDSRIVGRNISLDGKAYEVIGVMASVSEPPPMFNSSGAREPIDVYMPFRIDPASNDRNGYFSVAARLKPGIGLDDAQAQLRLVTRDFRRKFPDAIDGQSVFSAQSIRDAVVGGAGSSLSVFSWAVAFVLLIACANVASLLLIRSTDRKREIAIRTAVGASRGRIVRQLLTESFLLSLVGGSLGLFLGMVGIRFLLALNTVSLPRTGEHGSAVTADWRVLAFTALVSIVTCVLCGLAPALQASRADLGAALKETSSRTGIGFRRNGVRTALVVGEVALTVVLLAGAGLLIRTFIALRAVDPGFDPHHVLTLRVSLTGARFQKAAAVAELVRDSVQRISALPGVVSAASACCLPIEDNLIGGVIIVGRPLNGRDHGTVDVTTISPGYFDVFRIPLKRGRVFNERDSAGSSPAVIISEAMARRYWPGDVTLVSPLEASLVFPDVPQQTWRIVGIAGDVHAYGVSQSPPAIVYFPVAQAPEDLNAYIVRNPIAWSVRTRQESRVVRLAIQKELAQASGGLAVSNVQSMDEILASRIAGREFNMWLLTTFGCLALLLATVGIYGTMAYRVQQRTREIGVRLALGAGTDVVRNMVVFQGMRLVLSGVAIGSVAAYALAHLLASFLFGVKQADPVVFAGVSVTLSAVALVAVWLPARRAACIDPLEALRSE
jgi:predicted permease